MIKYHQLMTRRKKHAFRLLATAVSLALALLLLNAQSAKAHTRVEVGPYAIVVGWRIEPVIVGERNALTIEITEDEMPIIGAEGTLDVELLYGVQEFRANLNPTDIDGLYTAELFPTVRGQYNVRLFGTLGETNVDVTVKPEEVFAASRIQFPEEQPDPRELQKEITVLESDLQSARSLATTGIAVGALGLLLAVVALINGRRS